MAVFDKPLTPMDADADVLPPPIGGKSEAPVKSMTEEDDRLVDVVEDASPADLLPPHMMDCKRSGLDGDVASSSAAVVAVFWRDDANALVGEDFLEGGTGINESILGVLVLAPNTSAKAVPLPPPVVWCGFPLLLLLLLPSLLPPLYPPMLP